MKPSAKGAVDAIVGFANAAAGVVDFLDELSSGESVYRSACKAFDRTRKRADAIATVETCAPARIFCPCGSGLPTIQCHPEAR